MIVTTLKGGIMKNVLKILSLALIVAGLTWGTSNVSAEEPLADITFYVA